MVGSANIVNKLFALTLTVCLIGISLHTHDAVPVLSDQYQINHQISPDQPDCLACLQLLKGLPSHTTPNNWYPSENSANEVLGASILSTELFSLDRNKSPPFDMVIS